MQRLELRAAGGAARGSKTVSVLSDSRPATREPRGSTLPPLTTADALMSQWCASKENCMSYIFHPQHPQQPPPPKAMVRLSAYAKYGPAVEDADGRWKLLGSSGRVLQHHEELLLLAEEERALVYEVYGAPCISLAKRRSRLTAGDLHVVRGTAAPNTGALALPDAAFGEMCDKKHALTWHLLELTPTELTAILDAAECPGTRARTAAAAGGQVTAPRATSLSDAISNALLLERERRIRVLKSSDPRLEALRTDPDITRRKATRFYNRTCPRAYQIRNFEDPRNIQRALHRSAFQITEYADRNRPDVSYNIRCLRAEWEAPPETHSGAAARREGWDGYSCIRGCHSGVATTLRH